MLEIESHKQASTSLNKASKQPTQCGPQVLLTGAFHAGNGWEWGFAGMIMNGYEMDHSLIPYV